MANLTQQKREKMLAYLDELKKLHSNDSDIRAINEIENTLNETKYGLVWEEHSERVEEMLKDNIPVFVEDASKKIISKKSEPFNFLLEGDNLHSLKLLEKTHKGKIDVIYIDPPYNTGNQDFVFDDKIVDKNDGYSHSKWLSFMNERLAISRRLLSDDGVIFISIDDNEQAQLKLLGDSIFGEENFIMTFPRLTVKGGKTQTTYTTKNLDWLLCYAKKSSKVAFSKELVEDDPAFKYSDEHEQTRGKYHTKQALDTRSLGYVKSLDYPISFEGQKYYPGGSSNNNGFRWTWSREKYEFAIKNDFVVFKNNRIWPKKYLNASIEKMKSGDYYIEYKPRTKNFSQLDFLNNEFSNTNGTKDLQDVELNFPYAKPLSLIKQCLKFIINKEVIVLDFFAGSGTTGHAVAQLNKEDGGHRKYILCTNNENNICEEITYQRLKNIQGELPHNLKYYKTEFIKKFGKDEFLSTQMLKNIKELIELEHHIEIDDKKYIIVDNEEQLDECLDRISTGGKIFIAPGVLFSKENQLTIDRKKVDIVNIPEYYYRNELQEVGEI